jgi:hypothetical protein
MSSAETGKGGFSGRPFLYFGPMLTRGVAVAICAIAAFAVAACGGDETSYSDRAIIEKLDLAKPSDDDKAYMLGNDAFCSVEKNLLNDSDEVDTASDDKGALVITSREGNVGVVGVPVFPRDCKDAVVKKLSRLDPAPTEG